VAARILIVTPAPRGSRAGNRTTALRWSALLRQLGMHVKIRQQWRGEPCDALLAVHAAKSADSVAACAAALPHVRIAVLLAGTDVYPEFRPDAATSRALQRADALIALQPRAALVLPEALRSKVRTIVQSATAMPAHREPVPFRACVLAHLRPVKDPLLPFAALAHVPASIALEVVIAGRALAPELAAAATAAAAADPRCRWVGELPRRAAHELVARSHACIVPSAAEGGANVVSEAIAAGTPVLATRIPGNLGLLGDDWPGLFSAGDARGLGGLLQRAATDFTFYQLLVSRTRDLQHLVDPRREREALRQLLADLGVAARGPA